MNGALYISFFQGQLESTLEHVVQLAVREITGTVGASLSSMLLETARKEQENQRLRATIQARRPAEQEREESGDEESGRERKRADQHAVDRTAQYVCLTDSLRLDQRRRAVGQLKLVMERVLEFAVSELSKIVEDSFDDVLLELRKTEQENEKLKENLHNTSAENGANELETEERKTCPESHSDGTDGLRDKEKNEERGTEPSPNSNDSLPPAVISVSQDWVPMLNKVFGQKWCSDVWPVKDSSEVKQEPTPLGSSDSVHKESTLQRNNDGRSDQPKWQQDTENLIIGYDPQETSVTSATSNDGQLKSPSMLHRLLTLPNQLLDGDDESMESEDSLINAVISSHMAQKAAAAATAGGKKEEPNDEDVEEEEEVKQRSKSGRKVHVCKICGKKFNRAHLLKTHRQTHKHATSSPFNKLHSHLQTNSGKTT